MLLFSSSGYSQTVTGTIVDDSNLPVPGVTVQVKNTARATTSNAYGKYEIIATSEDVLVFSYVGTPSQQEPVGRKTVINIHIAGSVQNLKEVVVTALGIKKQTRGLGYSATSVDPDELSVNRTSNPVNALQGKIAGVDISSLGTGPGGTSKIRIRGQSSINGQNNPLIVINGVPIDNTNFNDNTNGVTGGGVTADGGDGLSSINPDDIETMTVLKGAPAAALYGSRAENGVIMITTKTRGKGKGIGVTYNGNYTNETPLDFTDYQKEYGQGEKGVRPTSPNPTSGEWSFGEKFAPGMTQTLFNTPGIPYVAQGSRIKEFYRHGQ
ncbi:MAG: TonB-dependent receptor plug domain-containing protein, partial [Ferruginibacter sp.]